MRYFTFSLWVGLLCLMVRSPAWGQDTAWKTHYLEGKEALEQGYCRRETGTPLIGGRGVAASRPPPSGRVQESAGYPLAGWLFWGPGEGSVQERSPQQGETVGKVTRADLARRAARDLGCTRTLARQLVDALFEALTDTIIRGDRIEVRGFGVWKVKGTRAKNARNPGTGDVVEVPARRRVAFKSSRLIQEVLSRPLEAEG